MAACLPACLSGCVPRWTVAKPPNQKEYPAQEYKRPAAEGGGSLREAVGLPAQSLLHLHPPWLAEQKGAVAVLVAAAVEAVVVVAAPVQGEGENRLLARLICSEGVRHLSRAPPVCARKQSCGSNCHRSLSLSYSELSHPIAVTAPVAMPWGRSQASPALRW